MYIRRFMDDLLAKAIRKSNVVLVTGARQVGKSTMIEHVLPDRRSVTLDDPFIEEQAKTDSRFPSGFFNVPAAIHARSFPCYA